ncbi:MAG TPA: M48 family metalloprotease [Pyrinomonadaceae bacterium]|nr:M48 family metalloprotease [Pyrinomonadaceae bacterium]
MNKNKLAGRIPYLEAFAQHNPGAYRLRVALLAALGYAYLFAVVLLLLALVFVILSSVRIGYFAIKIIWIPLVLIGLVLRSLWITLPVPDGTELKREQAPALFDLIDEVTKKLNGPKVHHVLVSDDYNASIVQIPQFGMFGWLRNYLVVGLPLLRALDPAEFRAALAHEVGHLSGKHGRFSGWIYRLRQSWIQILTRVHQERHYATFLFEPFLKWYAPYLNAYSFVLARAQEHNADQYAVDLAGREVTAVMLVRVMAKERGLVEKFWPNFFRQSKEQPKTPPDPFAQMLHGLDQPIGSSNTQKWFYEAMRVPAGYEDTHPALADRLAAIGFAKETPALTSLIDSVLEAEQKKQSAESYYLRELPENFLIQINRLWSERIRPTWRNSHEEIKQAKKKLDVLDQKAAAGSLTVEEQWERAKLIVQVKDENAALPAIDAILNEKPDHVGSHFAKGAILLEQHNPQGIQHLEKAMQLNPSVTGDASTLLSGFYLDQGNKELAETFRKRADQHYEQQRKLQGQAMSF